MSNIIFADSSAAQLFSRASCTVRFDDKQPSVGCFQLVSNVEYICDKYFGFIYDATYS